MSQEKHICLLYDNQCPVCRREAHWLKKRDRGERVALVDISADDFSAATYGLTQSEVDRQLHVITGTRQIVSAMPAVRAAYEAVGLGWVTAPTRWPVLKPLFDWLYQRFANNRNAIGNLLPK